MLVPNQKVKVKWCSKNKKWYTELGYCFTHMGDEFLVDVKHLTNGCMSNVIVRCDYCGKEYEVVYNTYTHRNTEIQKDACYDCKHLKSSEAFYKKYGVSNPLQVPEINKKQQMTCLKKYGVKHALQNKSLLNKKNNTCLNKYGAKNVLLNTDIYEKKKQTCLDKYGVEVPSQSSIIKEKQKQTCLNKYGKESYSQTDEGKQKQKQATLEKYGVEYILQVPEFKEKALKSMRQAMYKNGTVPTSIPQKETYKILKTLYGDTSVILNKPLSMLSLDIELIIDGISIDVEYDGRYWHQDNQKDRRRDEIVKSFGYKVLRIRADHSIPTEEQLIEAIDYLSKEGNDFTTIELDI